MVPAGKMAAASNATSLESAPRILRLVAECSRSRARAGELRLPHGPVATPVFMPVGTQATMKGITAEQLDALGCRICLGNTYHLGLRPVGGPCPCGWWRSLGSPGVPPGYGYVSKVNRQTPTKRPRRPRPGAVLAGAAGTRFGHPRPSPAPMSSQRGAHPLPDSSPPHPQPRARS